MPTPTPRPSRSARFRAARPVPALALLLAGAAPHFVTGRVVNTQGRPVADARDRGQPDLRELRPHRRAGLCRLSVTDGAWRVYAEKKAPSHGQTYTVEFAPDDPDSFAGQDGAVRSFAWKLTGEKPAPLVGTFGGRVEVGHVFGDDFYDVPNVEVTLTPDGPLLDGSVGKPITRRPSRGASNLDDVPIGRSVITARYGPPGKAPVRMRVKLKAQPDGALAESVTADFDLEDHNRVRVQVALP